jgi:hypothetical protein
MPSITGLFPSRIRDQIKQANAYLDTKQGQQVLAWADTMVIQQTRKKPDGPLMNAAQFLSPSLYRAIGLTDSVFSFPLALLAPNRLKAYRLLKKANDGTKLNTFEKLGILFKPELTSVYGILKLATQGKLDLNPLH